MPPSKSTKTLTARGGSSSCVRATKPQSTSFWTRPPIRRRSPKRTDTAMPFIPHTEDDVRAMLAAIGVGEIEALFDEIPQELRAQQLDLPEALSELEVTRLMRERAEADAQPLCFIGAGAYEHHVPAPVWEIATRGEFYSAYTPYQAEASQGTLQLIYEYQTMMAVLTGPDV